ncbi:hypothetical protein AVI51_09605 [Piscirickettsia salmonis]|uniref:Uncharacterized protein n=1 Tax=Piscirickettsia salmonis TaxID=1238 RepID=A0A9Q5VAY7_PISSA|nr:hypothetical protein [Piscirickettsia salmonis]ALA23676.1 hypothetical protein KW89_207 [Piscirickettsia salmonis]APS44115.1 hypothetical protein AVI48_06915 [Piscirickettsia salmonis]APS47476.1 hypothetical protein AVI49_07525 [Piscirickettsia salmonis]APS51089.1 hypothetical protein AVI50_09700 [Piscirickettsia salmonis]APS54297.1 hypothetical protein AVI51_09605 [Piscirickettsia salmonis]
MPLKRLNAQTLKDIAEAYQEAHPDYSTWLSQQTKDNPSEEQCAITLRELLQHIGENTTKDNQLGDEIAKTLQQFYGFTPPKRIDSNHPYDKHIKQCALQEEYLDCQLKRLLNFKLFLKPKTVSTHTPNDGFNYNTYSDSKRRKAIKTEIIRRIEIGRIHKLWAKDATAILGSHSNSLGTGTTKSLQRILTNPETFTRLYAPEIRDMDQRQLINLYVAIKEGIISPWANDLSHSLKAIKYTLMAKVENKGIASNVTKEEISTVIDDQRNLFKSSSTNARKHIDGLKDSNELKQALVKPSEPPKLIFKATLEKQEKAIEDMAERMEEDRADTDYEM